MGKRYWLNLRNLARLTVALVAVAFVMMALVACGATEPSTQQGSNAREPSRAASGTQTGRTSTTASAAPSGPSWSEYLMTRPGQSCTLVGDQSKVAGATIGATLTQTLVRATHEVGGERLLYRLTSRATDSEPGATLEPPTTYEVPYLLEPDGKLGVAPGLAPQPPLTISWSGSELYPTIEELRTGKSTTSTFIGNESATNAAARNELAKDLQPGEKALKFSFTTAASAAPRLASVHTPDGTFTNLVGVHIRFISGRVVNATPSATTSLDSIMTGFASALGNINLYFARGVGEVAGSELKLQSCTGG